MPIELYNDSDTSSNSECDSGESATASNEEEVDLHEDVEPELSIPNRDGYDSARTPEDQLRAQIKNAPLANYMWILRLGLLHQRIQPIRSFHGFGRLGHSMYEYSLIL